MICCFGDLSNGDRVTMLTILQCSSKANISIIIMTMRQWVLQSSVIHVSLVREYQCPLDDSGEIMHAEERLYTWKSTKFNLVEKTLTDSQSLPR